MDKHKHTRNFFDDTPSTQPNSIFCPQLPSNLTTVNPHQLLHLKVGLLNVAWQSGTHHQTYGPPLHQPITLPLVLDAHPTLISPNTLSGAPSNDSIDSFLPSTLRQLQASMLPSILRELPAMLASVKVKKLDSARGNTVGIIRTGEFVFTFTFKETKPAYHLLTVSSKRIRQLNAEADEKPKSESFSDYSLATNLTNFDLFENPDTQIRLLPLARSSASQSSHSSEGDGFYQGDGYASYLVSRHTLHVRIMPKRKMIDRMELERRAEQKRRERINKPAARFDSSKALDMTGEIEPIAERIEQETEEDDFGLLTPIDAELPTASNKRKSHPTAAEKTSPPKKSRHEVDGSLSLAATSVGSAESDELVRTRGGSSVVDDLTAEDEDWLNLTQ